MSHENAALVISQFLEIHKGTPLRPRPWDPSKIAIVFDHRVPAESSKTATNHKRVREFVAAHAIERFHDIRGDVGGICHQILPENGYVLPGSVVAGTDPPTTSHGALGAFAFGVGATEMASIWALAVAARYYTVSWVGERVTADLRNAVYARVLAHSPQFFETLQTGEVLSRLTGDTTLIQTVVGSSISMGLRSVFDRSSTELRDSTEHDSVVHIHVGHGPGLEGVDEPVVFDAIHAPVARSFALFLELSPDRMVVPLHPFIDGLPTMWLTRAFNIDLRFRSFSDDALRALDEDIAAVRPR